MKKLVVAGTIMMVALAGNAQHSGLQFFKGSFEAAVAKANAEGKKLFVDCYTVWCKPCRAVDSLVFPTETAGAYFNANFINVKMDAEKGDGPAFAKDFNIEAYPTFLVLNPDKSVNVRWAGGSLKPTPEKFIEKVKAEIAAVATSASPVKQDSSLSYLYNAVKAEPDPVKMELITLAAEKKTGSRQETRLVDICRELTAIAFAEIGNTAKAKQWIARISGGNTQDQAILSVVDKLTTRNQLAEAEQVLLPVLEKKQQNKDQPAPNDGMFPGFQLSVDDFAYQYGVILFKKGEYKKSLPYLAPAAQPEGGAGRRGSSEYYAMALAGAGEAEKALQVMTGILSTRPHASEAFTAAARKAFIKKYGNDQRYRQLLDSVAVTEQARLEKKIAAMAVNEPAPDFQLTDLKGKAVSLSALKGKTVILDFWATWCQPCVASFPGMQKAVDYYRNDSNVVFMFIHTLEKDHNALEGVRQFMSYKKYRFNVYMDMKNPITGKNEVVNSYNVRSIPAKFIIDKNGMIRYKNAGYISEQEAIPEIKTMVDLLNK